MSENILSVQNLHTSFHTDKGEVKAVNGVTFNLEKRQNPRYCRRIRFRQIRNRVFHYAYSGKERPHYRRQNPLQKDRILQHSLKSRCGSSVENAVLLFSKIL